MTAHRGRAITARQGRVRLARLTDLAALGELSRLSHRAESEDQDRAVRSLGLPVTASQVSVFSLFRMPLGAFQPHDPLYVYEEAGRLAGLARVERNDPRDEWTIVELDAVDHGDAGDIRFRLVQHLLRDGSKRGAARFHVACADAGGNVELFMQAGFARYGEEILLHRSPDAKWPALPGDAETAARGIRSTTPIDALQLSRLYAAVTPSPVARLEGYRLPDWERQGGNWRIPRSSLAPILRFADLEGYVQEAEKGSSPDLDAFLQVGVAKEDQPHYLRVITRPDHDPSDLIRFGLAVIGERSGGASGRRGAGGHEHTHGVLSPVRTYQSPLDRTLEEAGFRAVAQVSLLLKETLVRVAEPALVPAIR
jgi:hypothetical protein